MKIVMGSDHAGFELKNELKALVESLGHEVNDVGAHVYDAADDYPDFAEKVATELMEGRSDRGILLCGSGIGASIAANKFPGIHAANCEDYYSAHQGVEHDKMNVLVMGGRVIGGAVASDMVRAYLGAEFSDDPRHVRRTGKVRAIEERYMQGG
ncbi:MAG: ribose 5-phosphate isomerase B [Planctomycetota bacterium]|nr:ribose 5-phosphate isomerase B [Planctomycetota bacterium]MEC8734066.1 ribose 5-phosphate isomerase B [Planctomycetota bacterium]MED5508030.1 ribose 5-phosphate isomerase B [Planctomycetota bacterium]